MPSLLRWARSAALLAYATAVGAAGQPADSERVRWPAVESRVKPDAAIERRISAIVARMTLEEKVGQIIQPDISAITPDEVRQYKFGSILAGGNSSPGWKRRSAVSPP